ncbi:N-acetyltransferase [Paucidesulfovibrio longus]|jgi:amino-acid N-acetyltransferase|uniref:N-acetyltransferase n=1 Tax=Paucidesulfovibrio longus TaxID=889 RepID=UPI0003B3B915|nr:N-acetyltransferase [Paucidesulfovibrio longus]
MDNAFVIRKARISDVKPMHAMLLDNPEEEGLVLPRSFNQLYTLLRDFFVVVEKETGRLAGCCALSICWEELAEVRSLVITRDFRGRGLGRDLVEACLSEAVTLGLYKVFVLSNTPDFFAHLGFREVPKDVLPQKVWSDCLNCPKFPDCDETAMMMRL